MPDAALRTTRMTTACPDASHNPPPAVAFTARSRRSLKNTTLRKTNSIKRYESPQQLTPPSTPSTPHDQPAPRRLYPIHNPKTTTRNSAQRRKSSVSVAKFDWRASGGWACRNTEYRAAMSAVVLVALSRRCAAAVAAPRASQQHIALEYTKPRHAGDR